MSQHNPAALPEGVVFHGRYQVVRCINAGGMGAVYECIHLTTRKRRALKVMLPQMLAARGMRERFELEARVTAEIESEHIVETFDAGVDEATGAPFLVMELLRGDDLDRIVKRDGPLSSERVVVLLSQAALALDKTHAAGIVHRDLKPQNLFLTLHDDGSPRLKILDFGIAKVVADANKTVQHTAVVGTAAYMSPEQATGDGTIGPAADLYALGHIAYALLVGQPYWQEEQQALPIFGFLSRMIAGVCEPPSVRAGRRGVALPVAFDAWFARATTKLPGDRFERASTQIAELAKALSGAAPRAVPAGLPPPEADAAVTAVLASSQPQSGSMSALSTDRSLARPVVRSRAPLVVIGVAAIAAVAVGLVVGVRAIGSHHAAAPVIVSASPVPTLEATAPAPAVTPSAAPVGEPSASVASSAAPPPARLVKPSRPSLPPAPSVTAAPKPPRITTPL